MKQKSLLTKLLLLVAVMLMGAGTAWAQSDNSAVYTSNVTLSTTGGTSASTCKVKIGTTEYNGLKAGTGSAAGAIKITVPSGTKYLHMHIAGWNNETVTLGVSATDYSDNISLTSNSGISGNSPFTFSGDPTSSDYYKIITFSSALTANTELTFTASSGRRFVVWGVNSEESSASVFAPTFSPAAGAVEAGTEVTISSATEDATIYYTTDGSTPTTSSMQGTSVTINEATTIKAFAVKEGLNNSAVSTASYTIKEFIHGYTVDFENELEDYAEWTFTNAERKSDGTPHGGSYYGTTGGKATASFQTKNKVSYPSDFTCYFSKASNNTTASTWYLQVSDNGTTWRDVTTQSAVSMAQNEWIKFTADLKSYTDVYVRLYYSGSTAIRRVDDIVLTTYEPTELVAPVITVPETFEGSTTATITCTTQGATIYYSFDNSTWTEYTEALTITATTTIYAKAVKDGEESEVVSKTTTKALPTTPSITVNPATVNATAAGASGTLSVAYNNVYPNVGVDAEWYTDASCATTTTAPSWIEIGYDTSNNVNYTIAENTGEARTAYMKIWSYSAPETIVYSELITFAQAAPVIPTYATLPFSFDGGKADIDNTDGLYQDGLDSDYSSSPKLKFNGTGDYVLLQFSERPGTLTFDVKGNTFSGGTFTVQTSEDGVTYTDLKNYTELSATQSETFNNLGENVRYIKWVYTEKSSGNVALGNIALAKYTATVIVPSITVDPATVNALATDTEGTLAITCENLTISDMSDFGVMFFDENNQELTGSSIPGWIQVLVAEQDPNIGDGYVVSYTMNENTTDEARTAYFEILAPVDAGDYVYSNRVTITQAASVAPEETVGIFVKVTSTDEITSGQYLIVYESGSVAFDGSLTTLDAPNNTIDVTIENGMIAATTTNTQSVFNIDVTAGTLQSASGLYIGVSSNSNGLKTSEDATTYTHTFTIDENENAVIAAVFEESTMTLRYNKGSNQNRFRYYSGSQQAIQLYKFVADADDVPVTISAAGYATYCSEKDLDFSGTGLTAYKAIATNSEVSFKEVKQVPAGQGVLLKGAQGEYSVPVAANAAALTGNKFVGVTEETTIDTDPSNGIYVLMNKEQGVGFYKTTGTFFTLGAHTAYIPPMGSEARSFIGFDNTTTAINGVAAESMANGEVYNLQGQRVTKAQKGLYIMNGKKVVMK